MLYIGIDPGKSGGIVMLSEDGTVEGFSPMPQTDRDVYEFILTALAPNGVAKAVLEFVRSSPAMGVVSAFSFGRGYGALRMALCAAGIPYDEVTPQKWQKALGVIYPKGATATVRKNIGRRRAQEIFPRFPKMTLALSDAFLLAEYARRSTHIVREVEELS